MKISFRSSVVTAMLVASLTLPALAQNDTAPVATPAAPVLPSETVLQPAVPKTNAPAKPRNSAKKTPPRSSQKTTALRAETKAEPVLKPEPGISRQNNVNVRGQASINSEVIARLRQGQPITILEDITLKAPKQDEPARWYRISLPTNVSVWVHSAFVDPGNKTVKAGRLNMRGGPGENYSVLGRVEKGAVVNVIDTKGVWLKIEPPTNAFGFVAAHLVERTPAATPPAIVAAPPIPQTSAAPITPPQVEVAATSPPPSVAVAPVTPPPVVAPVPETTTPVVPGAPIASTPVPAPSTPAAGVPATPTPAPAESVPPAVATPTPAPAESEPATPVETVRKVVSREGILKGSVSIQAPTYFELRSLDTGKTINYVFSPSTNIVLKEFKGMRVMVSGEEVLDERWQNTPVLILDSLETVP